MSSVTDDIPSRECDVCRLPVYIDDNRAKRHVLCQEEFTRQNIKHYNRIRRRLAKEGKRPNEDQRNKAYTKALVDARLQAKHEPIYKFLAERHEREAILRQWEEAKVENEELDEPIPEDILAYDYFGNMTPEEYIQEHALERSSMPDDAKDRVRSNRGADNTEDAAGAPKDKQVKHSLTNDDIDRALGED